MNDEKAAELRIAQLETVLRDLRTSISTCRLYLGERGSLHYQNWLEAIDAVLANAALEKKSE